MTVSNVAETILMLADAGIERVFGGVGDSPNGMTEAIQKDGRTVLPDRRRQVTSTSGDGGSPMVVRH